MSYNPNFGLPPGQRSPYAAYPGAPGTQQPVAPQGVPGGAPMVPPGGGQGMVPGASPQTADALGLDPQLVQAVLALQGQSPQQAQLQRQLARAEALRGAAPAAGKQATTKTKFGEFVAPPNYLGAIAGAMGAYKADQLESQAAATGASLADQRKTAAQTYFDALRKTRSPGARNPGDADADDQ